MKTVRRLVRTDAEDVRALRLEGLKRHPGAFGASYEAEAARDLSFFADRLDHGVMFGGFMGSELCGIVGYYCHEYEKMKHKGALYGMYVRDEAWGSGLALELVQAIVSFARSDVEMIQLSVVNSNERARRFYEKCGFEVYGVEPRALKVDGAYLDEAHMWMPLT